MEELYQEIEEFLSQECKEKILYVYSPMQSSEKSIRRMLQVILQKQGKTENVKHITSEDFVGEVIRDLQEGLRAGYDFDYLGEKIAEKNFVYDFWAMEDLQYIKTQASSIEIMIKIVKARVKAGKKTMLGSDRCFAELCEIIPELARVVAMEDDVLYPRSVIV